MRKILVAVLFASFALPAKASEVCEARAELAKQIMLSRQAGVPITDLLESMRKVGTVDKATETLALSAYEAPRYQTKEHQQREVTEFQNAAYVACARKGH